MEGFNPTQAVHEKQIPINLVGLNEIHEELTKVQL